MTVKLYNVTFYLHNIALQCDDFQAYEEFLKCTKPIHLALHLFYLFKANGNFIKKRVFLKFIRQHTKDTDGPRMEDLLSTTKGIPGSVTPFGKIHVNSPSYF